MNALRTSTLWLALTLLSVACGPSEPSTLPTGQQPQPFTSPTCPGKTALDVGGSKAQLRQNARLALRDSSLHPASGGSGRGSQTLDSAGRVTSFRYDADGYSGDYTDTFRYDSAGRLTSFSHDADGYVDDFSDTYRYDSGGLLTWFSHDADSYQADFTETFRYDSQGHLTWFSLDADGYQLDLTETWRWDSHGQLTYFEHDPDGYAADFTETFVYDSHGRLTSWRLQGAGQDSSESFTYTTSSCS